MDFLVYPIRIIESISYFFSLRQKIDIPIVYIFEDIKTEKFNFLEEGHESEIIYAK